MPLLSRNEKQRLIILENVIKNNYLENDEVSRSWHELVRSVTWYYWKRLSKRDRKEHSLEDLIGEATCGLMTVIGSGRFDPGYGVSLWQFGRKECYGFIYKLIGLTSELLKPRDDREERLYEIEKRIVLEQSENGTDRLLDHAGTYLTQWGNLYPSEDEIRSITAALLRGSDRFYLRSRDDNVELPYLLTTPESDVKNPSDIVLVAGLSKVVQELPEDLRSIIELRLKGHSFKDIAKQLGINQTDVFLKNKEALELMRIAWSNEPYLGPED